MQDENPLLSMLSTEIRALSDPVYFAENIVGITPFPKQAEVLREFYRKDKIYTHLIMTCGMRSGKSELGAMITTYEIFKLIMLGNPQAHYGIAPGTPIFVLHVANSRQQAKDTIYAQTAGLLKKRDWFVRHGMQERSEEFFFPQYNIVLRCDHSNSASLAGRTAKCVFMDETARFKDNSGKFSGEAVYFTVSRAVQTFGKQGKVISISSPIYEGDFQMKLMRMGDEIPSFLTYHLPTWEMNPHITKESLAAEFKLNPETAWRDYGAKPPAASEAYFRDPISVRLAFKRDFFSTIIPDDPPIIKPGIIPQKGVRYFMAGDPAFKNDAFGLALVHREGTGMVVDFTYRFTQTEEEPEINAEKVKDFIIQVGRRFPLHTFVVDTWQFPETVQAIEQSGIYVEQNVVKKEQYDLLKEYIYTGNIKIPEDEILKDELLQLELRLGTKVDHPKDGSKDVADALANAVWVCHQEIGTKPEVYRPKKKYYERVDRLPYTEDIDESVFHEVPLD